MLLTLDSRRWALVWTGLIASLLPGNSFGWGREGHQMVAEIGAELSVQFFQDNAKNLGFLANVPDNVWKMLPTAPQEKPTHFFQPDFYQKNPKDFGKIPRSYSDLVKKYKEEVVVKNGTSPWRTEQLYQLALEAIRAQDYSKAVEYAGTMSHYIGDMSQPLHGTTNYDGQLTGNKGIHKFFETDNVQESDLQDLKKRVRSAAQDLLEDPGFSKSFDQGIVEGTFNELARAFNYKDPLINTDLKLGRKGKGAEKQLTLAEARMADGAASLALVLNRLWKEAGSPSKTGTMTTAVPAWVAPKY